jgi:cytidine diphosphoramidate kinase
LKAEEFQGVVWITGLARVGKTTTANALVETLSRLGQRPVLLDGDALRTALDVRAYDPDSRRQLAFNYARLAREISSQGFGVVVATISLFHDVHAWNRAHLPRYFEVLLDAPAEELARRSGGDLYSDSAQSPVVGRNLPVEWPQAPDLRLRTGGGLTPERAAEAILSKLLRRT